MLNCSYIFYKDVVWSRKASNFLRLINDLHPTWTVKQHSEFRCSEISILIFFSPIPKYCTASSTVSIYFSQIGILPFSILIATLLSSFSLWTKHFYLPMTIYNFIHCHRQIKLQYRWQFSTLPTSVLHRHYIWPDFFWKYHYHRYASSPCAAAAHFVKFFSLHTFTSMLYFSISSYLLH